MGSSSTWMECWSSPLAPSNGIGPPWATRCGLPHHDALALAHGAPTYAVVAQFVGPEDVEAETAWVEALAFSDPGEDEALPGA